MQNCRIATLIEQNELNGMAVCDPDKTLVEYVLPAFVDCVVPRESLPEMWMQPHFIPLGTASAKANWVEGCNGIFCHEGETTSIPIILCSFGGRFVISWLKRDETKSEAGEVCLQYNQFAMIKALDTRVRQDGALQIVPGSLWFGHPKGANCIGIFLLGNTVQRCNTYFKIWNETWIKLEKANELCNVADNIWGQSSFKQSMLWFCRAISVQTYINANKFESKWGKMSLAMVEWKIVGLAHFELALHVCKSTWWRLCPAYNIINNNAGFNIVVDW